jgi:uncharacterized protein (TIGR03382 family)
VPPAWQAADGQSAWKPAPVSTSIQATWLQSPGPAGASVEAVSRKKSTQGARTVTTSTVNQGDCNAGVSYRVTWTASSLSSSNVCNNLQIFVTNSLSCPVIPATSTTDGGTADIVIGTVSSTDLATGSGLLDAKRFKDMPGLGGNCPDSVDISNSVCASVPLRTVANGDCNPLNSSTNLTLRYDAKPPVAPGMNLLPQDSKIVVQLDPNGESGLSVYEIQYQPDFGGDAGSSWISVPDLLATKNTQTISGLTNGQSYVVRARSKDEVNNVSDYTPEQTATPAASNGFWGEYKAAGGHELGGCNATGATVPSVVAALAVLAALLRRRR